VLQTLNLKHKKHLHGSDVVAMRLRNVVASIDKKAAKELELYYSRSFPRIGVTLIVDHRFVQQRHNNVVSYVIDKVNYECVLMRSREHVIDKPSDLYSWLDHYDYAWTDGVGILPLRDITALSSHIQLQHDMVSRPAEIKFSSEEIRQALSQQPSATATPEPSMAESLHYANVLGMLW
jgi:hypothetical protein